jgi:hypothetical protein
VWQATVPISLTFHPDYRRRLSREWNITLFSRTSFITFCDKQARQMKKRWIDRDQPIPAHRQSARITQSSESALDPPPSTIAPQLSAVLQPGFFPITTMRTNQLLQQSQSPQAGRQARLLFGKVAAADAASEHLEDSLQNLAIILPGPAAFSAGGNFG